MRTKNGKRSHQSLPIYKYSKNEIQTNSLEEYSYEDIFIYTMHLIETSNEPIILNCLKFPLKTTFNYTVRQGMGKQMTFLLSLLPSYSLQLLYELAFLIHNLNLTAKNYPLQQVTKALFRNPFLDTENEHFAQFLQYLACTYESQ